MDINQRIEVAKINLKKAEQAKTVAETQKAAAETQQTEVVKQMEAESVTPTTISDEIARLESNINETLTKVEGLIPKV